MLFPQINQDHGSFPLHIFSLMLNAAAFLPAAVVCGGL